MQELLASECYSVIRNVLQRLPYVVETFVSFVHDIVFSYSARKRFRQAGSTVHVERFRRRRDIPSTIKFDVLV